MANYKFQRVVLACWLFFGICIFYTAIIPSFVEGKQIIPEKYRGLEHKGTIKTIVSPEDNDVIDCVEFYKQPAFDDPRIKDLQVESNLFSGETEMTNDELYKLGLYQNWLKYGECPNGTIPIRRTLNRETNIKKRLPNGGSFENYERASHEYAIVQPNYDAYFGARANLNVWNPKVETNDYSLTQIWVLADNEYVETIEAGWIVYPKKYDDLRTRFFIFWSNNSYHSGCWDLQCSGFVQVNKKVAIGGVINGISTYNASGYFIKLAIYKEKRGTGDWWLQAFGEKVGYWPNHLFRDLNNFAEVVQLGGEVLNTQPSGRHSVTEMGSGHFPYDLHDSRGIASYVSNISIQIGGDNNKLIWENVKNSDLERRVTRPECYNATIRPPTPELGTHFYYGGPGYSATCK